VRCVTFLPDSRHALSGTQTATGGRLILWDVEDGREIYPFEGNTARLGVAVAPDGRHALTSEGDGSVRLWRLPDLSR
jgi:WD40 repeat protein